MAKWKSFTTAITKDTLTPGLAAFFKKAGVTGRLNHDQSTADFRARQIVGLQLINFIVNGSSQESVIPPIQFGILRGSGSVFVDGVLIGDTKGNYPNGTPNKSYSSKAGDIVVGFNTAYAARWHERPFTPGGKIPSKQARNNPGITANVGNKYVEKHLKADNQVLWKLYAEIFKKEMGGTE